MVRLRRLILPAAGALVLAAGAVYVAYRHDIQGTRDRLEAGSTLVATRYGPVEVATWGEGPAVLAVHGAGGGYDQGMLLARAFGGDGFRWIAPSRFGYLRSPLPADASTAAQADAFADMLDGLGVEQVAILAMSGGVPPALQFALRHPERCTALVLLSSAPYAPLTADDQQLPLPAWAYQALFSSDLPYWLAKQVARSRLQAIFDVRPELRPSITPEETAFVAAMIEAFAPVTMRTDGLRNEAAAIDPQATIPVEAIAVPTLVVHARDDGINPFGIGEYTAERIPNAVFVPLPSGGHLLLGHQAEIRDRVVAFLHTHLADGPR